MADNQREDGIVKLTKDIGSTPPPRHSGLPAPAQTLRASSVPPRPVSPFQHLVGTDELPPRPDLEKEEGHSFPAVEKRPSLFPVVEKRPSLAPRPVSAPVLIMPIRQLRISPSKPPEPEAAPDDQIFDLSDEMVVEPPVQAPPVAVPPSAAPPFLKPIDVPGPKISPAAVIEPVVEPVVEPIIEPIVESVVEPIVESVVEQVVESVVEQVVEPIVEPVIEPIVEQVVEQVVEQFAAPVVAPPPPPPPPPPPTPLVPIDEDVIFEERETVIDTASLKGRGTYEEAKSTDDSSISSPTNALIIDSEESDGPFVFQTGEDLDIPVDTDESTSMKLFSTQDEMIESDEEPREVEEELDLADAEEMPRSSPPALPVGIKDGRKPIIRRRRKQNKEWWARIFNDDYVSTIPKATVRGDQRKVNFIEKSLALGVNALVLDLACGNGRHSVGMAKRGYRVVGIDLSLPMLAQAAELAQDERQNINFIHGDMRDLSFDKTFDAVFCMGTSFGYFDDETNAEVLRGVFRALKPGGAFLLEIANRDHVVGQTPELTWFEGNGSVCMEETSFDYRTSRLVVMRQLIMDGGRQVQNDISIRVYSLHEIELLLRQTGFELGPVSGHTATPGAFFGPDSVRIFVCAKRPR